MQFWLKITDKIALTISSGWFLKYRFITRFNNNISKIKTNETPNYDCKLLFAINLSICKDAINYFKWQFVSHLTFFFIIALINKFLVKIEMCYDGNVLFFKFNVTKADVFKNHCTSDGKELVQHMRYRCFDCWN